MNQMKKTDNNSKLINLHQGHRYRFRNSLVDKQWENISDHQMMEYILSCVIPRKDTNPMAHLLIDEFGSLANVLDASVVDLQTINGIGERTATFLHSIPNIFKQYKKSKQRELTDLSCPRKVFDYLGKTFNHMPTEELYLICVDADSKLIVSKQIAKGTNNEVSFPLKSITETAIRAQAHGIILVHNHPNGDPRPSVEDMEMTRKIYFNMVMNGINVLDHIITGKGDDEFYSFSNKGHLEDFAKEVKHMVGDTSLRTKPPFYDNKKI